MHKIFMYMSDPRNFQPQNFRLCGITLPNGCDCASGKVFAISHTNTGRFRNLAWQKCTFGQDILMSKTKTCVYSIGTLGSS